MNATTLIDLANLAAERIATKDAHYAIRIARESDVPVAWITGNSHMPPLRAFGDAEDVWTATYEVPNDYMGATPWEVYVETFEKLVSAGDVYLTCPENDNALYVVDLARWEYVENDDGDSLNDEWKAIA